MTEEDYYWMTFEGAARRASAATTLPGTGGETLRPVSNRVSSPDTIRLTVTDYDMSQSGGLERNTEFAGAIDRASVSLLSTFPGKQAAKNSGSACSPSSFACCVFVWRASISRLPRAQLKCISPFRLLCRTCVWRSPTHCRTSSEQSTACRP